MTLKNATEKVQAKDRRINEPINMLNITYLTYIQELDKLTLY